MRKFEIYGKVENGKLLYNQFNVSKAIKDWKDTRVRLTIEKLFNKRTDPQNRYYWGVVIHYFCEGYFDITGERTTPEEAHEFLKTRFNYKEVAGSSGEIIQYPQTTTNKTTVEFIEYQDQCVKFISEFFGIACPEPENN
jgi:hypothetical protein